MSTKSFFSDVVKVDKQRMSDDGDDCPPRPRRRIKRVVVMSSSDSDGDGDVGVAESRRKRLRILSDDDADESSGSSVVRAGTRRRRTLPKLKDSETESDSSGWASDRSDAPGPTASTSKTTSGFTSDSSEGNTDKCSICLLRFRNQEVGTPESCEHIFCLDCITEWSKNVNTCPVDRTVFNSIVVRACAGGRVLRTQPVKVVERRPSVEMFVIEDLTVCEVCGRTDGEESMLLCDGCDLGYHMQCLSPPLTQVPPDQWLCPNCPADALDDDDMLQNINLSEVEDILDEFLDSTPPTGPRPSALRRQRNVRRSSRSFNTSDQPSTSSGRRSDSFNSIEEPTTSRGSRGAPRSTSLAAAAPRRRTATRRKYKRRRTKTVVIEYEVQENGKFPITKKVTRKVKKRRVKKRQPRTAARRSLVRASVRARLAAHRAGAGAAAAAAPAARAAQLARTRAGIRPLSLLGNPNELDYFSDDADAISEEASTAVSLRPSANVFSAYRQARRKMLAVPSPPHAASAPDLLSDILESQTLLHSKNSVVSISVDGNVNIKLQNERRPKKATDLKREEKIDLSKATADAKEAPAYPGQNRGGGGWGGGYRGNYHREQTSNFNRGGSYDGSYGGGYQQRPGSNSYDHQSNNNGTGSNMRREEPDYYDTFPRRPQQPQQYSHDEPHFDRGRRPAPEGARPAGGLFANHHPQRPADQTHSRYSLNPAWPPYGQRQDAPPAQARHSFGGFENPLDMRMGQVPPTGATADSFSRVEAPRQEKAQPPSYQSLPEPQAFQPLAEPPVFNFPKISEVDKSEDEKSDPGLVIDTEKYDPTEPTHDDDSGEDDAEAAEAAQLAPPALAPPPSPPPMVHSILASMDPAAMNVPSNILDTAVRQVLKEHRNLIASPTVETLNRSDDESDGDCPNFSIYSAASVHIANNSSTLTEEAPPERVDDNLEDLVQEDDDTPPSTSPVVVREGEPKLSSASSTPAKPYYSNSEYDEKKKSEEEYKEKVSKRCPITTSKRNPIKIKLNTPSLIKRQVSLYDEEDASPEAEAAEAGHRADPPDEDKKIAADKTPAVEILDKTKSDSTPKETDEECDERLQSPIDKQSNTDKSDDSVHDKDAPHAAASQEERDASPDCANRKRDGGDEQLNCDEEEENNNDSSENDRPRGADVTRDPDDADADVSSERELLFSERSPKAARDPEKLDDNVEKMTESISETEDERSYTPCLDENKSTKDASFEDKGLEGLDTEMISEDEGNEMFSEHERGSPAVSAAASPVASPASSRAASRAASPARGDDGEIPDKKEGKKSADGGKKKKKKESKREGKEKAKGKKRSDIAFKKLSKSGKERNYRERDKDDKKERERRHSTDAERQRRRKEKRKDLERYDVRTLVSEKRRKQKDPFGRDVSPRARSPSLSPPRRSPSPRARRSPSRVRRSPSPPSRGRRSPPARARSPTPPRGRRSLARARRSATPTRSRRSATPARRRSGTPQASPRRRKRRRSASPAERSPPRRAPKKKKRSRVSRRAPPSPARKRRRSASRPAEPSPPAPASRPPSPRTPPPDPAAEPERRERRRRDPERAPRRRARDLVGPSKEVFTSGDNILVSVSFKEQERGEEGERRRRRDSRRERRRRRRAAAAPDETVKPVAIIDLERSPFRELTPSPKNVIVLSDSEPGDREPGSLAPEPAAPEPPPEPPAPALGPGPKTPPEPAAPEPAAAPPGTAAPAAAAAVPDAYDPFEPTRSPTPPERASEAPDASPPRPHMTLEAAQRSNLSADDVLARRPLTPVEKVMALLQSTRAADAEAEEAPPAPRIVLPSPTRVPPKLFPGKPSPIKSNPVKPMQAARLARVPDEAGASPYSPGSSDFGELFEPPPRRARSLHAPPGVRVPVRLDRKRGKTQVGVKLDDDNLKILDELPSSAVEMQVKSKFLKKLNRQERVVEEVKLVLKPHYNKKRVTKEEYKDILRRAVPKICHNKSGEINPTKIQALVEAYVKKFRKKHKLGVA